MQPRIYLCWFPQAPRVRVRSMQFITELIDLANAGKPEALAKSMRLNWMVRDVKAHGLLKPIVVDHAWQTIVGDTRLMAMDLLEATHVPVLAQLTEPQSQVITCDQELIDHCGVFNPCTNEHRCFYTYAVDWVDFDMPASRDHWHDSTQRLVIMQRYLDSQADDFVFDNEWYTRPVDWTQWSI